MENQKNWQSLALILTLLFDTSGAKQQDLLQKLPDLSILTQ